jgi:hypothetical protein
MTTSADAPPGSPAKTPADAPGRTGWPVPPDHRGLSAEDVLAHGGWHPGYARVVAVASDGDYGVALETETATGQNLKKRPCSGTTAPGRAVSPQAQAPSEPSAFCNPAARSATLTTPTATHQDPSQ